MIVFSGAKKIAKDNALYPGMNEDGEIVFDKKLCDKIVRFIGNEIHAPVSDIGLPNEKSNYLSEKYHIEIEQVYCKDFNFPSFTEKKYRTIFCFETFEHIQNPLLFMLEIKRMMDVNSTLYLSTQGRMRFMWSSRHFFEMPPKHIEKWICNPLELVILKKKRIRVTPQITYRNFIGIRPLLRLPFVLLNYTWIYKIMKKK